MSSVKGISQTTFEAYKTQAKETAHAVFPVALKWILIGGALAGVITAIAFGIQAGHGVAGAGTHALEAVGGFIALPFVAPILAGGVAAGAGAIGLKIKPQNDGLTLKQQEARRLQQLEYAQKHDTR